MAREDEDDLTARHLAWALETTDADEAIRNRVLARLPGHIVDVHAHATQLAGVGALSDFARTQIRSAFPTWSLSSSRSVAEMLYGDSIVTRLRMAHPYRGVRHERVNAYLLEHSGQGDHVILCGKPDDEHYTRSELERGLYVGLKMYPHYREPAYEFIREFFPDWSMRAAAEAEVPVVVHVRRPPSIAWREIADFADQHPDCSIVLAHLARETRLSAEAEEGFARLAQHPNIAADVSMAVDPDTMQLALSTLGPERVLYGSDEPFDLLRYHAIWRNGQRVIAPAYRYSWMTEEEFGSVAEAGAGAPLVHWQVLDGLVSAVERLWPDEAAKVLRDVFRDNALRWFSRVRTD